MGFVTQNGCLKGAQVDPNGCSNAVRGGAREGVRAGERERGSAKQGSVLQRRPVDEAEHGRMMDDNVALLAVSTHGVETEG